MKNLKITSLLLLFYLLCLGSVQAQIELVADVNNASEERELRINDDIALAGDIPIIVYNGHPEYGTELWTLNGSNEPVLLKDINPGQASSEAEDFHTFGNKVIFSALWSSSEGYSPSITDGTEEGTFALTNLSEGGAQYFTPLGSDKYVFLVYGELSKIWKTDGTKEGTEVVATLPEGANNIRNFGAAGNLVFFQVSLPETGQELWVTDGTEGGTYMVKDINPDGGSGPSGMFEFNNEIYFSAYTATTGRELWKSDGTEEGTVLVKDILVGSQEGVSTNTNIYSTELDGKFYFAASGSLGNTELWSSDGTAEGTQLVKDIRPGSSSSPSNFFAFGDILLFRANDGTTSTELWKTDGTEEGTELVKDIYPGGSGSSPIHFVEFQDKVYFSARDGSEDGLWVTDGTNEGTTLVKAIDFGSSSQFRNITASSDAIYIASHKDGIQLFVSDGTTEGTEGISQEVTIFESSEPKNFTPLAGGVVFTAWLSEEEEVGSLFYSDGTSTINLLPEGTHVDNYPSDEGDMIKFGDKFLFQADTETEGDELWVTDGTVEGTNLLKDINPGSANSRAQEFAVFGGKVIFQADDGSAGSELWITDGTEEGTVMVKDIRPGSNTSNPRDFTVINNKCYFVAFDGSTARELFVTDGTEEGTQQVIDLDPESDGVLQIRFVFNDLMVIYGTDDRDIYGNEMVISDGTSEGTQRITDINPENGSIDFRDWVVFDEYFTFISRIEGTRSLWKSDGTAEGTTMLVGGFKNVVIEGSIGESVIYFAEDENGQDNLQATNTVSGTTTILVEDIPLTLGGEGGLNDGNSAFIDGKLLITDGIFEEENSPTPGSAIWITDGTVAGTQKLTMDAYNNPIAPIRLFTIGSDVFFNGYNTETNSYSLWHTDGTQCGTQSLNDDPVNILGELASINDYLYFRGYTSNLGSELYRYDLSNDISDLLMTWYRDADGDGLGNVDDMIEDCQQPEGYVSNADDCNDTDDANLCALGLEDQLIKIYPNPTTDYIHLDSKDVKSIRLLDLNGRTVFSNSGESSKIDIQNLRPGIYILKVAGENSQSTHKIIKAN